MRDYLNNHKTMPASVVIETEYSAHIIELTFVGTVGVNEEIIRRYVRYQDKKELEQE
ncbi:hypothetical protein VOA_003503 [Vibrio sp. RC586]|nr:hypothetical protein VOA_003503 [Vibrio sp. RC586]